MRTGALKEKDSLTALVYSEDICLQTLFLLFKR